MKRIFTTILAVAAISGCGPEVSDLDDFEAPVDTGEDGGLETEPKRTAPPECEADLECVDGLVLERESCTAEAGNTCGVLDCDFAYYEQLWGCFSHCDGDPAVKMAKEQCANDCLDGLSECPATHTWCLEPCY